MSTGVRRRALALFFGTLQLLLGGRVFLSVSDTHAATSAISMCGVHPTHPHSPTAVGAAEVAAVRTVTADRTTPWTVAELGAK